MRSGRGLITHISMFVKLERKACVSLIDNIISVRIRHQHPSLSLPLSLPLSLLVSSRPPFLCEIDTQQLRWPAGSGAPMKTVSVFLWEDNSWIRTAVNMQQTRKSVLLSQQVQPWTVVQFKKKSRVALIQENIHFYAHMNLKTWQEPRMNQPVQFFKLSQ